MRKMRMSLLMLAALTFVVVAVFTRDTRAEIRFNATVHTPELSVQVGNIPYGPYMVHPVRTLPVRPSVYRIERRDLLISERLSWYADVPARELIRLRRHGYSWFEIGRWIDIPQPVVRAAMDQWSWDRYLHQGQGHAKHHGKHKNVRYCDDGGRRR